MTKIFYDRSGKAHKIGSGASEGKKEKSGKSFGSKSKDSDRGSHAKSDHKKSFHEGRKGAEGRKDHRSDDRKGSPSGGRSEGRSSEKGSFGKKKGFGGGGKSSHGEGKWTRSEHRSHRQNDKRGQSSHSRSGSRAHASAPSDPSQWFGLKGRVDRNKKGTAFLVFDRRDLDDLFIPRPYVDRLFHGDRVEVMVNRDGEIEDMKVLEHRFKLIFGKISIEEREAHGSKSKQKSRTGYLVYERKKAKEEIYIPVIPPEVQEGDWVKAELTFSDQGKSAPIAQIIEVIGQTLPATYDIQMVVGEFNLKEHHSEAAKKEAESFTLQVPGKDEEGRTDLRHLPFMTIDGERARDFDDAVYVESLGDQGYRLWVAIADVSHYVKEGTILDEEAFERATSVYFPERAFHMLPRALSEELCSLKPKVPRLSMAASMDYSLEGEKSNIQIYDAIIESRRRATYTEIEAEKEETRHADMFALYRMLKKQRHARGSIDFEFPEAEIILDEQTGEPSDIVVRERGDAHRLIEEFMIAANESVTEWMLERHMPFIYRIHEEPSPEAIEKFKKLARSMGMNFPDRGGVPRPKVLAEFIHALKNHPAEPVLATALLRSMRQAVYSATYGEHYGLASEGYTHFTSPIRRYPDLIVHRLLRATLHGERLGEETQEQLEKQAEHCSHRERVASEAEREAIRFKQVRLMAKHLGEEFEGKVNGMNDKGVFVQLWHPYCEGMIPVDQIGDDFYQFNEERMVMAGRKTKRTFQIGQTVKIQVVRVDMDARQIEFALVK